MFHYSLRDHTQLSSALDITQPVWSQHFMSPMVADVVTPFSYSVVAEICSRAWYEYFDRIQFEPAPRTTVLRHYQGRIYANLSVSAKLDAEQGQMEPLTLLLNEQGRALTSWKKPGMLAGLTAGRIQKRINRVLDELTSDLPENSAKARQWYMKTQELKWTQAEILQVMEEIERVGTASMVAFFAARHNLSTAYHQLFQITSANNEYPKSVSLVNDAFSDLDDLPESAMAQQILQLSQLVEDDAELREWIDAGDFENWQETLPHAGIQAGLEEFLRIYGHRAVDEGEIKNSRFAEDITPLVHSINTCANLNLKPPINITAAVKIETLLDSVPTGQRKQAQSLIAKVKRMLQLQSQSLDAFADILAGSRRWVQAATQEAMSDGRLQQPDDGFYFELEELKEMMTGERNVSQRDEIQAQAGQRRAEYAQWQTTTAAPLLIGELEADRTHGGYPAVSGQTEGPLRHWEMTQPLHCHAAIVGTDGLTSGWALTLPIAEGYIAANGTPYDPMVTVARAWHVPTVIDLGGNLGQLMEGAQTTVDGEQGVVDQ